MGSASSSKGPVLFRISATGLGIFILPLPTIGFITCVLLSIWKDYEASTWTHCGVCLSVSYMAIANRIIIWRSIFIYSHMFFLIILQF